MSTPSFSASPQWTDSLVLIGASSQSIFTTIFFCLNTRRNWSWPSLRPYFFVFAPPALASVINVVNCDDQKLPIPFKCRRRLSPFSEVQTSSATSAPIQIMCQKKEKKGKRIHIGSSFQFLCASGPSLDARAPSALITQSGAFPRCVPPVNSCVCLRVSFLAANEEKKKEEKNENVDYIRM